MHNAMANEVPFPHVGEGAVLRFRTIDLVHLRSKYGPAANAKPEYDDRGRRIDHFWQILIVGIESHDPMVMSDLLRKGLKQSDGKTPFEMDFDDLPFPLQSIEAQLMDAVFLSRWGETVAQVAEKLQQAQKDLEDDPLMAPEMDETSSTGSSGSPTEPV